jgi:RimJ/RimL family protein N-acetyltransferase
MHQGPLPPSNRALAVQNWLSEKIEGQTRFALVQPKDANFILSLRNDPKLNTFLSPTDQALSKQKSWIKEYIIRQNSGMEFYFIISHQNSNVGTVRLYDFKDNSFCWGSWLIRPGTNARVALKSTALVYELGFNILLFGNAHFDVRKENQSVNKFHRRLGAKQVDEDPLNYYYNITNQDLTLNALVITTKGQ